MRVLPRSLAEPATEPVTLAQLRAHVSASGSEDDALLLGYLIAARTWIEEYLGRAIAPRTVTATFEEWPAGTYGNGDDAIELLMPVSSVDAITYTAADGSTAAWTDFIVRQSQGGVTRVRERAGTSWPVLGDDPIITLTATAGFDVVPEAIVTGILQLAGYLYADRDGVGDAASGAGRLPGSIKMLVSPWRWRWLG